MSSPCQAIRLRFMVHLTAPSFISNYIASKAGLMICELRIGKDLNGSGHVITGAFAGRSEEIP